MIAGMLMASLAVSRYESGYCPAIADGPMDARESAPRGS